MLDAALMSNNCRLKLSGGEEGLPISDYEVCLVFEESNDGNTCMVYADNDSDFYFYEYFAINPELFHFLPTNNQVIDNFAELRDTYLHIFNSEGLLSIKFTTKNDNYKWFVDKLNSCKVEY